MIFEARLVFALIDVFFGGSGRYAKIEGRDFTPTETPPDRDADGAGGHRRCRRPGPALMPVKIEFINREMNPHFANIVSPTEIVVVNRFRIDFDGRGGEIHLVLPYSDAGAAEGHPACRHAERPRRTARSAGARSCATSWRNRRWTSSRSWARRRPRVGKLIDMRPGDVIPIDFDGQATVLADGIPLFWGELGQQRGQQVVRVSQMNTAQDRQYTGCFVRKTG